MNIKDFPHCQAGIEYATKVVTCEILAGKYTQLACKRHLDDLAKDGEFYFDYKSAERACKFIELMPHTKGRWARERRLIKLIDFQAFIVISIFGWKRKTDDTRRFREAYVEMTRKQGKSVLAAAIGNYMFTKDEEAGAEVYSGATNLKQAMEVFTPARQMVIKTPALSEAFGIRENLKSMNRDEDGSRFEPVVGKPGDGASPHCAIIDEYHEHETSALYDTMVTGIGAREHPLIFIITTAGFNLSGPCYQKHKEIKAILDGNIDDEEKFGIIYHIDEGDDWLSEDAIYKANPAVGKTVPLSFFQARQKEGRIHVNKQNAIKTKHFNQWVSAKSAYFNIEDWSTSSQKGLTIESFNGEQVYVGVDLASKRDITAVTYVKRTIVDGVNTYNIVPVFYIPEQRVVEDGTGRYAQWVGMNALKICGDTEIDFAEILEDIRLASKEMTVVEVAYDPHLATHFAQILSDEGLNVVEFLQRPSHIGEPMDEFGTAIEAGRVKHDGNPMMAWMIGNVINSKPNQKLPFPGKQGAENKIDGPVSVIMAVGRIMADVNDDAQFLDYIFTDQN